MTKITTKITATHAPQIGDAGDMTLRGLIALSKIVAAPSHQRTANGAW
jgi:hypothetical protein